MHFVKDRISFGAFSITGKVCSARSARQECMLDTRDFKHHR